MSSAFPFVSVLTPTCDRRKFIPTAIACFKHQTYPQDRMEWIVLDDGKDKVKDLFDAAGLKNVRYRALPEGEKLPVGAKRNMLNDMAKGDICVCFDDDDYYPPDRVKKAVIRLRSVPNKSVPVAGASKIYLYFSDRDEIWSIGPYNPNHCTNGTMSYWRSYAKDHRYDDTAEKAEERLFMDDWKTPVIQMNPEDTMLVICHAHNTFDKRILLQQKNPLLKPVSVKMRQLVKEKPIRDFYLALAKDYIELDKRLAEEAAAAAAAAAPPLDIQELDKRLAAAATAPTLTIQELDASSSANSGP